MPLARRILYDLVAKDFFDLLSYYSLVALATLITFVTFPSIKLILISWPLHLTVSRPGMLFFTDLYCLVSSLHLGLFSNVSTSEDFSLTLLAKELFSSLPPSSITLLSCCIFFKTFITRFTN